jgi:hypothetical protein
MVAAIMAHPSTKALTKIASIQLGRWLTVSSPPKQVPGWWLCFVGVFRLRKADLLCYNHGVYDETQKLEKENSGCYSDEYNAER